MFKKYLALALLSAVGGVALLTDARSMHHDARGHSGEGHSRSHYSGHRDRFDGRRGSHTAGYRRYGDRGWGVPYAYPFFDVVEGANDWYE